jgi:hypothetical protein
MKLLTAEFRASLPPFYSQVGADPIVHAKFFRPNSQWTSYVTEVADEDGDFRFLGFVCRMDDEWGYFVLPELDSARYPIGLPIGRWAYRARMNQRAPTTRSYHALLG